MDKFFGKVRDGIGFGLGLILVFFLLFSVYAFVEPSSGPTGNYVIDWLSPLNKMHNDTNQRVDAMSGMTANSGMYDNRIPEGSFPAAYTEVCFKSGSTLNDQHTAGQSTNGGNCLPGDVGFIIEQSERTADYWEGAKTICLQIGMRLPEIYEFKYSCKNAATFGLNSMTGNSEWSSNFGTPMVVTNYGVGTAVMGGSGCNYLNWDWIGRHDGVSEGLRVFRCVR